MHLFSFQAISRLNINLAKSELVRLGVGRDATKLARIIGCKSVDLPIKYLEIPLRVKYKDVVMWDPMVARFEKRLIGWKGNFQSKRERLTLIRRMMANIPIYYMSLLTILVSVVKRLQSVQYRYL